MDLLDEYVTVPMGGYGLPTRRSPVPQARNSALTELRIHFLRAGVSGSPVLLLHGTGVDSARLSWGDFAGPLAASGHRVFAPDLPGYGESDRPDVAYDTDYYVSFVAEFMRAVEVSRVTLVGLSLGGALALGTALRWPERVDRLVLVDSYGLQRTVAMHRLSYLMVHTPGLLRASYALAGLSRGLARAALRNILHDVDAAPPGLIDAVLAEARRPGAGRAAAAMQRHELLWDGLRTVYMDRLGEIRAPALIVHGREDKAVPLACAEEARRRIPAARLDVIEGAGHWPQRDQQGAFERAVVDFLKDA